MTDRKELELSPSPAENNGKAKDNEENTVTTAGSNVNKKPRGSNANELMSQNDNDASFKIDFYINIYRRKRRGQEETNQPEIFLQSIEGHVEPGTVCAIIGPRNSGKQRLLALLSGRSNKHICLGEVHVNNIPFSAPQMRALTSYLTGVGSTLVGQMTVEEAVDFTARLVLPSEIKEADRKKEVHNKLEEMGLLNIKHRRIDGGYKKYEPLTPEERVRVNLAQVLIEKKKIIFLDEPTKGLDLLSAERVIRDIIKLAEAKYLTVFVSLEHPTKLLLEKFHKCLFLTNGKQVYFGRVQHTVDFFSRLGYPIPEETSIYDHILSLTVPDINVDKTEETAEEHLDKLLSDAREVFEEIMLSKLNYQQREKRKIQLKLIKTSNDYIKVDGSGASYTNYPISWLDQVNILMFRFWISFKRDLRTYVWRLLISCLWVAIYWTLDNDLIHHKLFPFDFTSQIAGYLIGLAGIQCLSLLVLSQAEDNAKIFESDMNQNLYRPSAYVFAHLLVAFISLPWLILPLCVGYFFILGLHTDPTGDPTSTTFVQVLIIFGVIHLLVAIISEVLALSMALLSKSSHAFMYLGSGFIHFLWILFSGGTIRLCSNINPVFIALAYASPIKWALDGLLITTIKDVHRKYKLDSQYYPTADPDATVDGSDVLNINYCFNDWAHANDKSISIIALSGILGVLLLFFFISARVVQVGRD